jgi:hypothetical protein
MFDIVIIEPQHGHFEPALDMDHSLLHPSLCVLSLVGPFFAGPFFMGR